MKMIHIRQLNTTGADSEYIVLVYLQVSPLGVAKEAGPRGLNGITSEVIDLGPKSQEDVHLGLH